MLVLKALASGAAVGLIGALIGPFVALSLMEAPEGACGMWAVIPLGFGLIAGGATGAVVGFVGGLFA